MTANTNPTIAIYPVGLLADLQHDWRARSNEYESPTSLCHGLRYLAACIRRQDWSAARAWLGGYNAEATPSVGGPALYGAGWTRRRAAAALARRTLTAGKETGR